MPFLFPPQLSSFSCVLGQHCCQWYGCFLPPECSKEAVSNRDLRVSKTRTESLYRKAETRKNFHGNFLNCCRDCVAIICCWSNVTLNLWSILTWENKSLNAEQVQVSSGGLFLNLYKHRHVLLPQHLENIFILSPDLMHPFKAERASSHSQASS